ncbi:MAG TPA: SdrD B-like domain-containing protein [Bacteroidota bacterium]|nr:SdrD B-like domain-containing protein [Bacteroidota bacterium]
MEYRYPRLLTIILSMFFAVNTYALDDGGQGRVAAPLIKNKAQLPRVMRDTELRTIGKLSPLSNKSRDEILKSSKVIVPRNKVAGPPIPAGTYSIPSSAYPTVTAAVNAVNSDGIAGNVVFELTSTTAYTENPLFFGGSYPGAGTFNVTIKPAAGVAATIEFVSYFVNGKGISFAGADNVTIDGVNTGGASLTLKYSSTGTFPTNDAFAATIYVTGGSNNVTIKNANIQGQIVGAYATQTEGRPAVFVWYGAADAAGNSNITVDHCTITNATYGIKCLDEALVGSGPMSFTYNNIGGAFGEKVGQAALFDAVLGLHYDNNVVDGIEFNDWYWNVGPTEWDYVATFGGFDAGSSFFYAFGQPSGGHVYNSDSASTIANNYVKDVHQNYTDGFPFIIYGLLVRVGDGPKIYNNRITGIATTDLDGLIRGIRSEAQASHNSVRLTGALLTAQGSQCMLAAGGTMRNNALSNEMTGGSSSTRRAVGATPAGTSNGNAMYSTGQISSLATLADYLATGKDANSCFAPVNFTSDLHVDNAFASSANNTGVAGVLTANDIDNAARSATTPDAGADEFTGVNAAADVAVAGNSAPSSLGTGAGLPVDPKVTLKNNSQSPAAAVTVKVTIKDGTSATVYSQTASTTLAALESQVVTMPTWSGPTSNATHTMYDTITVGGGADAANDVYSRSQSIVPLYTPPYSTNFNDATARTGWLGTGDFSTSSAFTKLTGPRDATAWVTRAGAPGAALYTNATLSTVLSPFFTTPASGNLYVGFYHSINTEASWDRSIFQFSLDTGKTWKDAGTLNDPNGINWYATTTYKNAAGSAADPDCWDQVTAVSLGFPEVPGQMPVGQWTSDGDCGGAATPEGPFGWIYVQLKISAAHPTIMNKPMVRFRYVSFADAGAHFDGWAMDNFFINDVGNPSLGSISGIKYSDLNGNGSKEASEPGTSGVKIYLTGSKTDSATTDGTGAYSFAGLLAGAYNVSEIPAAGVAITQPTTGSYSILLGPGDILTGKDFGNFTGGIYGKKYRDDNMSGTKQTSEPGLSGWVFEAHKDSLNGPLINTGTSDANGDYYLGVGSGKWWVKEVVKAGWKVTGPSTGYYANVNVDSGAGAIVTGKDFGNFGFGTIRVELTVDLDGDGIKDAGDVLPLPSGDNGTFTLSKNGVAVKSVEVGNGTAAFTFDSLELGTYQVAETAVSDGWIQTLGGTDVTSVFASSVRDTAKFLNFYLNTISGQKFRDLDSNGVKDAGDPGVKGWGIKLTRVFGTDTTFSQTLTDSLGNYMFADLHPGKYTVAELSQVGWTRTFPTAPGTYTITANGAKQLSVQINRNFGNYCLGDCPVVGVIEEKIIPTEYALRQNYPNPFNPQTNIVFDVPENSFVQLKVFNVIGQEVVTLVNEFKQVGRYTISLDAAQLPSGVYFYKLDAKGATSSKAPFIDIKKMLLMR